MSGFLPESSSFRFNPDALVFVPHEGVYVDSSLYYHEATPPLLVTPELLDPHLPCYINTAPLFRESPGSQLPGAVLNLSNTRNLTATSRVDAPSHGALRSRNISANLSAEATGNAHCKKSVGKTIRCFLKFGSCHYKGKLIETRQQVAARFSDKSIALETEKLLKSKLARCSS